jgi:hypothetical protein
MGRSTTHQTKEDKSAAKALANRQTRAKKAEEEYNLLSRHPNQTAVLSRGQVRKRFLEEINANRVELVPLSIPTLPEITGVDEESGDIESGMYYRIDKLIKENEDRSIEDQWADDDFFKNSNDGDSSGIIN